MCKLASSAWVLPCLGLLIGCGGAVTESPASPPDERADDAGRCRHALEPRLFGCANSLEEAFEASTLCGVVCAGPAGNGFLYFDDCTPTVRCAYDSDTKLLAGAYLADEAPDHCGYSYSVVGGDFPAFADMNGFDRDAFCSER